MILVLDVSSTAIGFARFDGIGRRLEAGIIEPTPKSEKCPCRRAYSMSREVQGLLDEHALDVDLVLIERPPPTQGKRRSNPSAQHQAFGLVMGVLLGSKVRVEPIHPATWTKGKKKALRNEPIRARHGIAATADKGGDACDALALGEWWFAVGRMNAARSA